MNRRLERPQGGPTRRLICSNPGNILVFRSSAVQKSIPLSCSLSNGRLLISSNCNSQNHSFSKSLNLYGDSDSDRFSQGNYSTFAGSSFVSLSMRWAISPLNCHTQALLAHRGVKKSMVQKNSQFIRLR